MVSSIAVVRFRSARLNKFPWLLLALFATLPLVWVRLGSGPVGTIGYFHLPALALIVAALRPSRMRLAFSVIGATPYIWAAFTLLMLVTAVSFLNIEAPFDLSDIVRQTFYAGAAIAAGAALLECYRNGAERHLIWAAPLALAVFVYVMNENLGGTFFSTLQTALAQGDPNVIIFKLFKVAFAAASDVADEAQSNWRHDIMFSLVLAGLASIMGARAAKGMSRLIGLACVALVVAVAVLSMSRSAWLALAIMGAVSFMAIYPRSPRLMMITPIVLPFVLAVGVYLFAFTSIPWLLIDRLADGSSYEGRATYASDRLAAFDSSSLLTGLPYRMGWAHHLFIDYLTATGIVGGIAAAALLGFSCLRILDLALRSLSAADPQVRFNLTVAACLMAMPVTRFISAPKGHPFLAQWVAMGLAGALIVLASKAVARNSHAHAANPRPTKSYRPVTSDV